MKFFWNLFYGLVFFPILAEKPPELYKAFQPDKPEQVVIKEKIGAQLPLQTILSDENGERHPLSFYLQDHKPTILALIYYQCPNLCNLQMNGLLQALKEMQWSVGKDFQVIWISIDSRETAELATKKKEIILRQYNRLNAEKHWHFLTGEQAAIRPLADSLGFDYRWHEKQEYWIHSSASYILTAEGRVSHYLYGIRFDAKILRLALIEATDGRMGNWLDSILLSFFSFQPEKNQSILYAYNLSRAVLIVSVIFLALFLVSYWQQRKKSC